MPGVSDRIVAGVPAAAAGVVVWADALLGRMLLRTDGAAVYFLGHPIAVTCWLKSRLGLPCPTCGITRSIVLSLHGDFGRAWQFAPAGPLAVAGALGLATALFILAIWRVCDAATSMVMSRRIRRAALLYAAAGALIWIVVWSLRFAWALHALHRV